MRATHSQATRKRAADCGASHSPAVRQQAATGHLAACARATAAHIIGRMEQQVSVNWKYATFGLGALIVVQFLWWNAKAPEVLKLGQ